MAQSLKRELGVLGGSTLGLGSIVGAGVFVSTGMPQGLRVRQRSFLLRSRLGLLSVMA
ncbi:hypothetical protein Ple7327_1738 [Pleurocapsa sp. PCC 7327]|uniref:hypothetical protein n=1 Tax=Pleurocapsa sp. PCC 7327 TaxID=118163 RepID=UPI00029F8ED2|nr:hypothetical protein [Pleurocapsa sp. PCC 7327]AFY77091.1 hypothetical protein Ple7327_1738 [Pleurocapsa sp. PCC 7327]